MARPKKSRANVLAANPRTRGRRFSKFQDIFKIFSNPTPTNVPARYIQQNHDTAHQQNADKHA